MNQFEASIASFEVAINQMREYVGGAVEAMPLHEIEAKLLSLAMAIALAALGRIVAQVGTGDVGPVLTDEAGKARRRVGIRPSTYRSLFGPLAIARAYYHSEEHGGACPLDAQLAVPERSYSYHVQHAVCVLATQNAYEEGSKTLVELLGIPVPKSMGEAILADAAEAVPAFRAATPAPSGEGRVLVIQADAKGIVMVQPPKAKVAGPKMRRETPDERQGKKKMANAWTIYSLNPAKDEPPAPINRKTFAHLGTKREAFERLAIEAKKRGYGTKLTLFLSDGDPDLADLQREFFPEAKPCLDWIHLTEYLWDAAYVFHAKGSAEAKAWVETRQGWLLKDDAKTVVRGLKQSLTKGAARLTAAQTETLARVIGYMERNTDRMPYGTFMCAGYPIGTGSIEGGIRHLIGDRMERTGMRWKPPGAQAMLHMRSVHINGEMADFEKFRIKREQERLYGAESRFGPISCSA